MSLIKVNVKPKYKATLKEDFEHNSKLYKKGHEFHVVGYDSMRGYDLQDKDDNTICEIRMITDKFDIQEVG